MKNSHDCFENNDVRSAHHFEGLVQEIRNSIANELELRLSCTNRSISCWFYVVRWIVFGKAIILISDLKHNYTERA